MYSVNQLDSIIIKLVISLSVKNNMNVTWKQSDVETFWYEIYDLTGGWRNFLYEDIYKKNTQVILD